MVVALRHTTPAVQVRLPLVSFWAAATAALSDEPAESQRAPSVYWMSRPVSPNETILVAGAGMDGASATFCHDVECRQLVHSEPAATWESSVQIVLPASCLPPKACFLNIAAARAHTATTIVRVNAPDVIWSMVAEESGVLRVFGRALAWSSTSNYGHCISAADTPSAVPSTALKLHATSIPAHAATCYEAQFRLPPHLGVGLHDNLTLTTPWGESPPFSIRVSPAPSAPLPKLIRVDEDHSGNVTNALLAASSLQMLSSQRIRVQLGAKTYNLTTSLNVPNRTVLAGAATAVSVLRFTLPSHTAASCHPSNMPVHSGLRCDNQGQGCDCLIAGIYGGGSNWAVANMTVVLVSSPAGAAAIWVPPSARQARLLGLEIQLLQDSISNNAIRFQGVETELAHSNVSQLGSCWFGPPNGHLLAWGGTAKAALVSDGASGLWIHGNNIFWNCGGWGCLDRTERTVLEDNRIVCTKPNNETNGVIEGGGSLASWDKYRIDRTSRWWSVARNLFSRPAFNGVCDDPSSSHENCTEDRSHQNWSQRETLTTDGSGEYGHGYPVRQAGTQVTMRWSSFDAGSEARGSPDAGSSLIVVAGGGLGQRRFVTGYDNDTCTLHLDRPLDGFVNSRSLVAIVPSIGEKLVVGNRFSWTEVVQWYANTYMGVHADNQFENCNVLAAGGNGNGALQAAGMCYYGAGGVYFAEFLGNVMVDSDGISLRNNAAPEYTDNVVCGAAGFGGNVSWLHWIVVRRNSISGISQAALSVNRSSPPCGSVTVSDGYGDVATGYMATTDVVAEHNVFDCPAPGKGWSNHAGCGTTRAVCNRNASVKLSLCEHCVVRDVSHYRTSSAARRPEGVSSLKYLSYFGANVSAQHTWLSLAINPSGRAFSPGAVDGERWFDGTEVDAFFSYGVPSLIHMPEAGVFTRGVRDKTGKQTKGGGLVTGWQSALERFAANVVVPRMKNNTAVGVFIGDEICCHNSSCWHAQLYPISAKLRAVLGPKAILYLNECIYSIIGGGTSHGQPIGPPLDKIAPDLDLISVDLYRGYTPSDMNGTVEAVKVREFARREIYPRLHVGQRFMAVPGTFACSNLSYMPLESSSRAIVEKLASYFEWLKQDPLMAGLTPWHFNYRQKPQASGSCDMRLGAANMPLALAELRKIGSWIKSYNGVQSIKSDDKAILRPRTKLPGILQGDTDWAAFLSRSDPVNSFKLSEPMTVPDIWLESAFLGNGMVGCQVLVCPGGICTQSLLLGTNTTLHSLDAPHRVVIPLARADVSDIRTGNASAACTEFHGKVSCFNSAAHYAQPRLGIGALILTQTSGAIVGGSIRTHLHNASISVRIRTTEGDVNFNVFVHATRQLVVVRGLCGSGGERHTPLQFDFVPAPAVSPAQFEEKRAAGTFTRFTGSPVPGHYAPNPPASCSDNSCRQSLLVSKEGRGWVTSWRSRSGGQLLVTITSDIPVRVGIAPKTTRASTEAASVLAAAEALNPSSLAAEHSKWWAQFYFSDSSGAFVSLPAAAAKVEQFHWITLLKIGSENACRRFVDSAFPAGILDNCLLLDGLNFVGPMQKTKYPFAIWDMNVEGAQWGSHSSNLPEQSLALARRIPEQLSNFVASVPREMRNDSASIQVETASLSFLAECMVQHCESDAFPLCVKNFSTVQGLPDETCLQHSGSLMPQNFYGGLPWICHNIWLVYRHTMDESILHDLIPLLKRATNLYIRTAHTGVDKKLHLPLMESPEYGEAADTSFDHALFRWCLRTLIHSSTILPQSSTGLEVKKWQSTLRRLSAPRIDAVTGSLMIGANLSLHSANKHFSHLFSIFPLGLQDWSVEAERELWEKSLAVFQHYNNPTVSDEGFTYLGMALMTLWAKPALPGGAPASWADSALGNVSHFFRVPQLGSGTMYADHAACGPIAGCRDGMAGPCNESPIMASLVLQHMLLQSWNGVPISIFPAVPASWADARFARMRAEGAVLVTAVRANFSTIFFSLNATVGGNVSVHSTIVDLNSSNEDVVVKASAGEGEAGVFAVSVGHSEPWAAVFYSRARGPPSSKELGLALTPLPADDLNLWGSRPAGSGPPTPPPPEPLGPLPPCPTSGCAHCGGCHWPFANNTLPDPKQPVLSSLVATTVACEAKCGSMAAPVCAGFTRKDAEQVCYFYSKSQVSGLFSHLRPDVSWHPNPNVTLSQDRR